MAKKGPNVAAAIKAIDDERHAMSERIKAINNDITKFQLEKNTLEKTFHALSRCLEFLYDGEGEDN